MGTGYTRNDTSNNIANGNVIDAADLDGEFNAIESAFNESTGHTHDGTSAEGAPITVVGPNQEYVSSTGSFSPKTDDTYDLGTSSLKWKDLYIDGVGYFDSVDINGGNIDGTVVGLSSAAAGTFTDLTASDLDVTGADSATVEITESNGVLGGGLNATVRYNAGSDLAGVVGFFGTTSGNFLVRNFQGNVLIEADSNNLGSDSQIIFNIDNSQVAKLTDTGRFGIGTISPATALDVNGDVTITDKIIHSGDTDTTIRFPAADTVTVETAGSERMRIDSSGKVGIGTNNPGYTVDISDTATYLRLSDSDGTLQGSMSAGIRLGAGADLNSDHGQVGFINTASGIMVCRNMEGDLYLDADFRDLHTDSTILLRVDASTKAFVNSSGFNVSSDLIVSDKIVHSEDTNTAIRFPAADTVTMETAGSERMRIDSSGIVDILGGAVELNGNTLNGIQIVVADDAVAELTFPRKCFGMLNFTTGANDSEFPDADNFYLGFVDFGGSPVFTTSIIGSSTEINNTDTLTGTTGTDTKTTIGLAGTSKTLYIENRKGFTQTYNITLL